MRSGLALAASALAALAAVIASADRDAVVAPAFVVLTFLAGVEAWALHPPLTGRRRVVARTIALAWALGAI